MQLWKVVVTSEGPSSDLRSILPVLVAAAQPWFGKSSGRQVDVTLKPDGPEVQAIRARSNAHSAP
jgi:hypothetical protein